MNDSMTHYLAHVDRLLADPLQAAREAAGAGREVVGYIGDDIPVPLIFAAGASPLALRGDAGASTERADQILESAFTPALRAIAERWLTGGFDFLKAVIFPRSDDSAQRLYYYLCELQRRGRCAGPRPLLYDVANLQRPMSAEYTRESTRRLGRELGASDATLAVAVRRVADREALLADLRARRASDTPFA